MPKPLIISADELKKTIPGYNPAQSDLVHRESAKLADKLFEEALRTSDYEEVILMSGGGASGKTEYIGAYLANKAVIILDGTSASLEGVKIKVRLAEKFHKKVTIIAIWPDDLQVAFAAFRGRNRKYPDTYFYQTHAASRKALLQIAESNLPVVIEIYGNVYAKGDITFYAYEFHSKEDLLEKIRKNQYTSDEIFTLLNQEI